MKISNFKLKVGKKEILKNFSYEFNEKFIYNIYGPNEAGKSTFAKALAGYLPSEGFSEFKDLQIGIISSYSNVPEEVSVAAVLKLLGKQSDLSKALQSKLAHYCNIKEIIDRKHVRLLSDGEKRKLMIYAALNCKKDVLILDEFMSNLDRKSGGEIREFILKLQKEFRFLCINITHAIEDARKMEGKILYLDIEEKNFIEIKNLDELIERM